ncbi:MAG: UDP-galactopyranose mutase, partial [Sedimentisphaerales bacterium]
MPINLETINSFYDLNLKPSEAQEFIRNEAKKEKIKEPKNLEEKALSLIGRPLYEAFIKGYTIKQWDKDPKELPPTIITRLPVRYD